MRSQYALNGFKSWNMYSLYIRQDFAKKSSIQLAYQYIPYFYVRTYRDEDLVSIYGYEPRTFKPFEFSKEHYGLTFRTKIRKKLSTRLNVGVHRYFHNQYFTEYDAEKLYIGTKFTYPVTQKLKITTGYQFAYNEAKGTDEPGESKLTSDDPDGTFLEHKTDIRLAYILPKWFHKSHSFEIKGNFISRGFNTLKAYRNDPTHVGRLDLLFNTTLQYNLRLSKRIKTGIFFNYNFRNSTNNGSEYYQKFLSDEKNYNQSLTGFTINYKLI